MCGAFRPPTQFADRARGTKRTRVQAPTPAAPFSSGVVPVYTGMTGFAERLLTVVATCRQQARAALDFLVAAGEAALRNSQPPSLIPIPQGC